MCIFLIKKQDQELEWQANENERLAQELQKAVIKKFKKRNVSARFEDKIWTADLAKMASLFYFNPIQDGGGGGNSKKPPPPTSFFL